LLSVQEAARLRVVCEALKVLVMGWPMELEDLDVEANHLEAALTCFPATESLTICCEQPLSHAEERRMVELLRQHGGTLKVVRTGEGGARRLLMAAVLAGALPNLTDMNLSLWDPTDRQILSEGTLGLLEEVRVWMKQDDGEQLAALEHLRRLPHLRRLTLYEPPRGAFPCFIPPSLKSLNLTIRPLGLLESLLRELPSMLQASGAALEEISLWGSSQIYVEFGAVLAQVLRACSSTLKTLTLTQFCGPLLSECAREMVPGFVSCCDTLEVLHCPWAVFGALPATGPSFPRLTELNLGGGLSRMSTSYPGSGT
jgi:hypothetical protein